MARLETAAALQTRYNNLITAHAKTCVALEVVADAGEKRQLNNKLSEIETNLESLDKKYMALTSGNYGTERNQGILKRDY